VCGHEPGMTENFESEMKFEQAVKVLEERYS
jgi:hypothetical protein